MKPTHILFFACTAAAHGFRKPASPFPDRKFPSSAVSDLIPPSFSVSPPKIRDPDSAVETVTIKPKPRPVHDVSTSDHAWETGCYGEWPLIPRKTASDQIQVFCNNLPGYEGKKEACITPGQQIYAPTEPLFEHYRLWFFLNNNLEHWLCFHPSVCVEQLEVVKKWCNNGEWIYSGWAQSQDGWLGTQILVDDRVW